MSVVVDDGLLLPRWPHQSTPLTSDVYIRVGWSWQRWSELP